MKKRFLPTHLKHSNRRFVYDMITGCGTFTRSQLSQKSGISGPTILKIIDFFLEKGIVVEADQEKQSALVGRAPVLLRFNPDYAYCLGAHLDGEILTCGILDMSGGIKYSTCRNVSGAELLELYNQLPELIETCISQSRIGRKSILGLGIGLPGVLDAQTAVLEFSPLTRIGQQTDLKPFLVDLERTLGLPILIENDVNAVAWGEYCMRRLPDSQDMIYLYLGAGLGAGIILNGQLLRGQTNMAGKIGYLCCDPDFIIHREELGWLERRINQTALASRFGWDSRFGLASLDAGRQAGVVAEVSDHLALSIASMNAIVGVEYFVLGGPILRAMGQPLFERVAERLSRLSNSRISLIPPRASESGLQGLGLMVIARQLNTLLQDDESKQTFVEK